MVEALIALMILAVLLAAIALAVHASIASYQENDKIASVTQSARFVLNRIVNDIRTAAAVDSTSTKLTIIPPDDGSGLQQIQYEYDSSSHALVYRRTVNGQTTSHTLIGGGDEARLTVFYVLRETGTDWQGLPCTKSIKLRMGFTVDDNDFAVTASADPRRNQLY